MQKKTFLRSDSEQGDAQVAGDGQQINDDARPGASRRSFLRRLAVGGGLALGVGGLSAYVVDRARRTVVILPNGDAVQVPSQRGVVPDVDGAFNVINELAALREALAESDAERRGLAEQLADAQAEIARLNGEQDELVGLMGLYEALEDAGLDEIVSGGLAGVGVAMAGATGLLPLLEIGVNAALDALGEFVEGFPGPQSGLIWLKGEVSALLLNLQNLEARIEEVVQPVAAFATLVADFILDILRKLPFGLGSPSRGGLESMQTIITILPPFADGITLDVLNPLETWFGQDNKTNLMGKLVQPIENQLIEPANETASAVTALESTYANELVAPAEAALGQRASIRAQIEAQRARLDGVLVARSRSGTA